MRCGPIIAGDLDYRPGRSSSIVQVERPMPLPRRLAKFNRVVTNRILGPPARVLPGFAIVLHVGRRSGRTYRTPVNLFRRGDGYVIALMYGADSQWVRNVLAAGAADIETRGRRLQLVGPEVVRDPARSLVPRPVRVPLRLVNVDQFMLLERADTDDA
jgi:deazaflavin-dependent oxidoreductase (nitroreductase family)